MKKTLVATLLTGLAALSLRADLIWYESFNYVNGPIIATGTNLDGSTNWFRHSGSASPSDAIVSNFKLQNSATGGSLSRSDDVNRKFVDPYTNSTTVLFASFTVNCTNVPTASNYFAHFMATSSILQGRVFGLPGTLPGTWRLGVSGAAGTPNKIFPADLAANTDYQVVVSWDPVTLFAATLWVNPLSSADLSVVSSDAVTAPPASTAFGFRQASSFSSAFFNITNLASATTFEEAATNVWSTNAVAPVVAYQPRGGTNFVGDPLNLSVVAAGQGLSALTYQWRKDGGNISNPNGNSNVFSIASASAFDSGSYDVVVSTLYGVSATSLSASVWVTNPPVPPTINRQPTNTTVFFGQTATLSVEASGSGTLTYAWYYDGSPATGPNVSGADTATLTIVNVQTNNGTTGTYRCDVGNIYGTTQSSNAVLSAVASPAVTIGYLRTLVDPVFFLPTNTTALWTVTGIVTSHTNLTTAANSSFYLQDDTGGIDVFFGGTTAAQPEAGDNVTVTGPLGQFNSLLELNLTVADPSHQVITNSHGNPLPPGKVLPFSFTNSPAFGGVGNAIQLYQGSVVTFTNVYFPAGFAGTNVFAGGVNYVITNLEGATFPFRVDARVGDIIGKPIPPFAWTVSGPMSFFLGNTVADRSSGYQILPTLYADIVTNAPPPVTGEISVNNGVPVISWLAQPYMSYSIYRALSVKGPYLPLVTGLTFNSTAGRYADTNVVNATLFYRIASP